MENNNALKLPGCRMPAEWESHEAIWLSWPRSEDSFPKLEKVRNDMAKVIKAIHPYERVELLVSDEKMQKECGETLKRIGVDLSKVTFRTADYEDAWMRDCGPIFVKDKDNKTIILKWKFNSYGNKFPELQKDGILPQKASEWLGLEIIRPDLFLEGGAIDVNGEGVCLTTEQCLLNENRNPGKSKEDIEKHLLDYLGVEKTIWLKEGLFNDHTDGHIDEIARFVAPGKIVCAYEDNKEDENFLTLKNNYEVLKNATDFSGRKFEIIRLPMPHMRYADDKPFESGEKAPVSYTNFYIGNEVVLVSVFNDSNDAKAIEILQSVFPGRKIIPIDSSDLAYGGGAIHCLSQQQPSVD